MSSLGRGMRSTECHSSLLCTTQWHIWKFCLPITYSIIGICIVYCTVMLNGSTQLLMLESGLYACINVVEDNTCSRVVY